MAQSQGLLGDQDVGVTPALPRLAAAQVQSTDIRRDPRRHDRPVGAENPVTSSDVQILVYEAAEPISS
jgi:hypothetical protein